MDVESTVAAAGVVMLLAERIIKSTAEAITTRRRQSGASLHRAFEVTGGVIQDLHELYLELKRDDNFHSVRLLSAHDSGDDLVKTMLWKSSILTTMPQCNDEVMQWQEQPLDHEYLTNILRPIVENGTKTTRATDLSPTGALGAIYLRLGITQSISFLVRKTDSEIVYAVIAFSGEHSVTPRQLDLIRVCHNETNKRFH